MGSNSVETCKRIACNPWPLRGVPFATAIGNACRRSAAPEVGRGLSIADPASLGTP